MLCYVLSLSLSFSLLSCPISLLFLNFYPFLEVLKFASSSLRWKDWSGMDLGWIGGMGDAGGRHFHPITSYERSYCLAVF